MEKIHKSKRVEKERFVYSKVRTWISDGFLKLIQNSSNDINGHDNKMKFRISLIHGKKVRKNSKHKKHTRRLL